MQASRSHSPNHEGIKGTSARRINQLLGRKGSLWQDESFDRIMRAEEFEFKRNYIMANPVDAGLCERPEDYQWLWLQAQAGVPVPHDHEQGQGNDESFR
jgi:hypothetical protein